MEFIYFLGSYFEYSLLIMGLLLLITFFSYILGKDEIYGTESN